MSQVPILSGIYTDTAGDFRTKYPANLVPVPKGQGISQGFLRPADGITANGTGPGVGRGGIVWNGVLHRVMGTKLVTVSEAGVVTVLGDVGGTGQVTLDAGFGNLAIASAGKLRYWDGTTLTTVTDPDLGVVVDVKWVSGYFLCTDGTSLIVTELSDPVLINPLKYGSAESDPDPILAVDELRNEAFALGRYTIEAFQNVGGDLFPFARIDGAQVTRGVIGTHAYAKFAGSFAFVGSGKNEAPAVWLMTAGDSAKLSTAEIETILAGYTETQLAACVVEARVDKAHQTLLIHLPDQCLAYDAAASAVMQTPVWYTLHSGLLSHSAYRARNLVWCYDRWNIEDPLSSSIGVLTNDVSSHYGQVIGWDFGTTVMYLDGDDGIIHELELVCLPGRAAFGAEPTVWTSSSRDGLTWGPELPKSPGKFGERTKRLVWRQQGRIRHYRMQRFRGTSEAHLTMARLEVQIEPMATRAARG